MRKGSIRTSRCSPAYSRSGILPAMFVAVFRSIKDKAVIYGKAKIKTRPPRWRGRKRVR